MLESITRCELKQISVPGGDVYHAMKRSSAGFKGFGEAYFSFIEKDAIKAWKKHLEMTLNLVVPKGEVLFVFTDGFGNFREEIIGESQYARLSVPARIWFGFKGLSERSLLLNIADIEHQPQEAERKELNEISYQWGSE